MKFRVDFDRYVSPRAFGVETLFIWPILAGILHGQVLQGQAKVSGVVSADVVPVDQVVNADAETYDSQPSLGIASDGGTWMAWHAYHRGRDRVLVRRERVLRRGLACDEVMHDDLAPVEFVGTASVLNGESFRFSDHSVPSHTD